MQKKGYIVSSIALITLLIGAMSVSLVFARGSRSAAVNTNSSFSAQRVVASMLSMQSVDMQSVPAATTTSLYAANSPAKRMPLLTGNPMLYAQHKAAAVHNVNAPFSTNVISNATSSAVRVSTAASNGTPASTATAPATANQFQGMADSSSICPPATCQPPDMALA